ncbi:hypothetical protein AWN76_012660 [Rhodothermaceae bacterium RA]|nr:hypothetical protein AWN76_012660 [Rhodothermaceae bacterium RA]
MRLLRSLWDNLFDYDRPETPGEVAFFRLFEGFIAVFVIEQVWRWGLYARRLDVLAVPHGLGQYVDLGWLLRHDLVLVNAAVITVLMGLGLLRRSRYAYLAAFLLMHLQYVARFSLGKVEHGANLLGMTLLGLSLGLLLFDAPRVQRRFTLGFTYFFVGLGYALAACSKLVGTGLHWADGRHLWLWIQEKGIDGWAQTGTLAYNALQELVLSAPGLATLFLALGLLAEASAPLIWWRRYRMPVLLALIGMHAGVYLIMGIQFRLFVLELILLALPWSAWIDRWIAAGRSSLWSGFIPRGHPHPAEGSPPGSPGKPMP